MPLLILSGPEKSGKSSVAAYLEREHGARVRHWGMPPDPPDPFHLIYLEPLKQDVADAYNGELVVWDRSWACEAVYSKLLKRGAPHTQDGWLMEWLYGRAASTVGLKVMLLGPQPDILRGLRSADDHPVDPSDERLEYARYADEYFWWSIKNDDLMRTPAEVGEAIYKNLMWAGKNKPRLAPPAWAGSRPGSHDNLIVLGEARNESSVVPGSWLPFTSRYTELTGRALGNAAFHAGWTNVGDDPDEEVRSAGLVVACGTQALNYTISRVVTKKIHYMPHPSWLYRWGAACGKIDEEEEKLRSVVREFIGLDDPIVPSRPQTKETKEAKNAA